MQLLAQAEACCTTILAQHESAAQLETQAATIALTNRLQEMKARFERSIGPSSEEKILEQRQLLHELILEHETLVELYQISKRYGSLPSEATTDQEPVATSTLLESLKVELSATPTSATTTLLEPQAPYCHSKLEVEMEAETEKENVNPLEETPMDLNTSQEGITVSD